jgi:diaminopropionate ammonia-lyase
MSKKIDWKINEMKGKGDDNAKDFLARGEVEKAKGFHSSFPQYAETPLVDLKCLSEKLGLAGLYLKDESYRFGLNAFKVLGGSFAMAKYIAQQLGQDVSELPYDKLISNDVKAKLGDVTFYTATDGNHGRGVAWTANQIKQKSVVHMPKGSSEIRRANIAKEGSKVDITDMNYDDAVRLAAKEANEDVAAGKKSIIVQDTAWDGYEEIPAWIMQGYGTMALEAVDQLKKLGVDRPTHIFVQAGVGSLAGAVQGFFANEFKGNCPITTVIEADEASCLYRSAVKADGSLVAVGGDMPTIMAGLACGEGNTIGWKILKHETTCFVSAPNYVAANGMRIAGNPCGDDRRVISGESGAVTLGLVYELMTNPAMKELKDALKLNADSKVLVFSTEGDTDPDKYREIVWTGSYHNCEHDE